MRVAFGALLGFAALFGCRPEGVSSSSTIALEPGGARLWVTSPDDDAVVALDADTLEEVHRLRVEGAPQELVRAGEGWVISLEQASEVARVSPDDDDAERLSVPCGGTRGLAVLEGEERLIAVACPDDDRVVLLDDDGALFAVVEVRGRPEALVAHGRTLFVGDSAAGVIHVIDAGALARSEAPLPLGDVLTETRRLEDAPGVSAVQLFASATTAADEPVFAYQLVSHDEDRERPPELGGYGGVVDEEPRIAPRLSGRCGERYARFDGGPLVASGPSALAYAAATHTLWIAHRYTDNVVVLRCDGDASGEVAAVFHVGRGPRGIAVSADGRNAFVDVGFDHAVARLELPDDPGAIVPLDARLTKRRSLDETALSALALEGRSLFFDAVNTHLTPSGVVTCGTCHPGGGDDGLSWFLHTPGVPRKLRRTPPAWGARDALSPFHWDGALSSSVALIEGTIRELMEGDALLVDTAAMAAYLAERSPPFPRPVEDEAAAARGEALFHDEDVRCAECHLPPLYGGPGLHEVTAPSEDPDGVLAAASVPSLVGVRGRAPYLHDGRAPDLSSLFTDHNEGDRHGRTSHLDDEQVADLVTFLESL